MAQVLTLLAGAASDNGFHGIRGRFRRKGLLSFADRREGEAIVFRRLDTGSALAVNLNISAVPGDPAQGERLMAILEERADDSLRTAFAAAWQDRVRRLLLEFADDPGDKGHAGAIAAAATRPVYSIRAAIVFSSLQFCFKPILSPTVN